MGPGKFRKDAVKVNQNTDILGGADMGTEAKRPTGIAGME